MKREEITHLASLSRLRLSEEELTLYGTELPLIVDYVSTVSAIASDDTDAVKKVGARYNVLRDDVVTNVPDQFTESILREMPHTKGRHMAVKKILKAK